jgi:uncharacterized damage-inducible protein DinB
MLCYNAQDLARSFRTVRTNTIKIAEEIPEEKYSFEPAPGVRTIAQTLAHIAIGTVWTKEFQSGRPTSVDFQSFSGAWQRMLDAEKALDTKAKLLEALSKNGDDFASWLEKESDEFLAEQVHFPAPMQPPSKTRFEMILGVKEHEMHHRAQLMLAERLIGITPHLTREMEARMAQFQQQMQPAGAKA